MYIGEPEKIKVEVIKKKVIRNTKQGSTTGDADKKSLIREIRKQHKKKNNKGR